MEPSADSITESWMRAIERTGVDPMFPEMVAPAPDNKFHRGNDEDGKHYWLTPPELYAELDAEFHFDFDPCPYPLPDGLDGLTCEWGQSNYVNPPFGAILHKGKRKGPTAWVRKAIAEHRKDKTVVFVYPLQKWVLMLLQEIGADVRNLGDVRWLATEDGSTGPGIGQHVACFILRSAATSQSTADGTAITPATRQPSTGAPLPAQPSARDSAGSAGGDTVRFGIPVLSVNGGAP